MRESRTSKRRLTAKQREMQAVELRKKGFTYDEIASVIGYRGRDAAYKAVRRNLEGVLSRTREATEHLRVLELERLDRVLKPMMEKAETGATDAIDRVLRISERRSKLLGLDVPAKMLSADSTDRGEYNFPLTNEERTARIIEILESARKRRESAQRTATNSAV